MSRKEKFTVKKLEKDQENIADDFLVKEEPLEIRIEGHSVAVVMRTPGHDQELAAGFMITEGLIQRAEDIFEISNCPSSSENPEAENMVDVLLKNKDAIDFKKLTRHVFSSSSCGICGKATIESVFQNFPPVRSSFKVARKVIANLPEKLRSSQDTFELTGGLHASGIFNASGELLTLREDVGRHNAVDKVIGHALLNNSLPFSEHILLVSGRISFEIVQKALAARIPIIAAISAPSSLAVTFGEEAGQTLIGFLRDQRMNIYSHPQRIV